MLGSAGVAAMPVSVERRIGRFEPEPHNPASSIQYRVSVSASTVLILGMTSISSIQYPHPASSNLQTTAPTASKT
jgi:hypothetical protein